jgi:oligopeptide/dipeptide ABC transporter ATP-binding protein
MPLLDITNLEIVYKSRFTRGGHRALRGIDLHVNRGETVGVVGESGSGKSTLAKAALNLIRPAAGSVTFDGRDLSKLKSGAMRSLRRRMQMVFQDPIDSLNPRRTVAQTLADSLKLTRVRGSEAADRIDAALRQMGLDPTLRSRRPHELSGGQAQRVGLARALVLDPELVVFDEPTSALDVSVQAQLLELIRSLTEDGRRAYVYISHDLGTVRGICDRVAVMYLGEILEEGPTKELFSNPLHPYTRALLSSVHSLHGACIARPLELSRDLDEADASTGCSLVPRCPYAAADCSAEEHGLIDFGGGHRAACSRIPEIRDD